MKVTTKGQVTIPLDIREKLNIRPGSEVEFEVQGNVIRIIAVKSERSGGRHIVDRLRGRASVKMTTDEIMALTRGEK